MAKGTITHIEIPADDPERAKKFYSALFGWTTEDLSIFIRKVVHPCGLGFTEPTFRPPRTRGTPSLNNISARCQ